MLFKEFFNGMRMETLNYSRHRIAHICNPNSVIAQLVPFVFHPNFYRKQNNITNVTYTIIKNLSPVPVAHICNPSDSGGRITV
jgi:hypothetical protein